MKSRAWWTAAVYPVLLVLFVAVVAACTGDGDAPGRLDGVPSADDVGASAQALTAPLASWKMNEGAGTTTTDASGNNLTCTLGGLALPTWGPGHEGSALALALSNWIDCGDPAPLTLQNA